jgi:hypothetical protein
MAAAKFRRRDVLQSWQMAVRARHCPSGPIQRSSRPATNERARTAGTAEIATWPGCKRRIGPRRAEGGKRRAAERGTSGSADAFRPLRYRDLGLAACISYDREGLRRAGAFSGFAR